MPDRIRTLVAVDAGVEAHSIQAMLEHAPGLEMVGVINGLEESWRTLQETRPDPYLTVSETVELAQGCYRRPLAVADVLDVVGLASSAPVRTATLSGGQ